MGIHYAAIVAWSIRYKEWIWSIMLLAGAAFVGMLLPPPIRTCFYRKYMVRTGASPLLYGNPAVLRPVGT